MRKIIAIAILAVAALSITACNTFQGMGEDISDAGQGISSSAQKVKDKINQQ